MHVREVLGQESPDRVPTQVVSFDSHRSLTVHVASGSIA